MGSAPRHAESVEICGARRADGVTGDPVRIRPRHGLGRGSNDHEFGEAGLDQVTTLINANIILK